MAETPTRIQDVYPSRVGDAPEWIVRQDPVVYGRGEGGPLSREKIDSYRQNGYLFIDSFFSDDEVEVLRQGLNEIWQGSAKVDRPEIVREPESDIVRSVFAVHRDHDTFRRLAREPRLIEIVQQILDSEVYVHQSRINFKPGFTGKEFYWHSDFETWHVEDGMPRMRALSCSIALEDNYHFNGPLMVVPGSQNQFVSCVGETPLDNFKQSLRKQEIGTPDLDSLTRMIETGGIDTPVGKKGSIVFFDCNTMHGSNGNITPYPRSNVFLVYNSVENQLVQPFSGQQARPEYIAHRDTLL